jgi:hypothetical protein
MQLVVNASRTVKADRRVMRLRMAEIADPEMLTFFLE